MRLIQTWFDEGTRNKVFVLGRDPGPVLRNMVDPQNLPKVYGGEMDWTFEDEPMLDDEAAALIHEMPKGPIIFVNGKAIIPPDEFSPEKARTN